MKNEEWTPEQLRRYEEACELQAKAYEQWHEKQEIYNPGHYNKGNIEVWDFIMDQDLNFMLGNVIKYICRAGLKGDKLTDLKKAQNYLNEYVKRLEANDEGNF